MLASNFRPLQPIPGEEPGDKPLSLLAKMRGDTAFPKHVLRYFKDYPARSFISDESRAILYSLIRTLRPEVVVEVGTLFGGTTEVLARAVWRNGSGVVHTTDPFGGDRCPAIFAAWPAELQKVVQFHPLMSMDFFLELERRGLLIDLALVDGNHDYEFALFDLLMTARRLRPGGIVLLDNVDQSGPFHAARDFLAKHPGWIEMGNGIASYDPSRPFEPERSSAARTTFLMLRSPPFLSISEAPMSWGQAAATGPSLAGFALDLPAQVTSGTLHYLVTFRSFSVHSNDIAEGKTRGSVRLDLRGDASVAEHRFEQPSRPEVAEPDKFTFEIDVSWQADPGAPPLSLAEVPRPLAGL
ncbi:Predicted O-methyltransferase YrrM [Rhodospirillales bacterium URHD0017]|nr:Predicted O-methyltransferase YrrM [Rhodospirillales bacterium URHD0017]